MLEKQTITIADDKTIWDDLGIIAMARKMRQRKVLVLVIPLTWLIFSNAIFLLSGVAYSGELLVVPSSLGTESTIGSGLSSTLSSFGLDVGSGVGADPNFTLYLETWRSSWFAQQMLANQSLTHQIFAGEWSERDKRWLPPSGIGSVVKPLVKEMFGGKPARWTPPTTEDMVSFLQSHVHETQVRGQISTKVTLELKDPVLVKSILQFGHTSINAHLAEIFRKRADQNASYITDQLNRVSVAEYRQALLSTLTQVERTRMLAFSNPEFAASELSLYVTSNPVKPQSAKVVLISLLAAIAFYFLLVLISDRTDFSGVERWLSRFIRR